jgi:BlaI family penicillinase repressor
MKREPRETRESAGPLPDAELDVLACLWREGKLTARQIRESLAELRPMTHSAVSTLLSRLQEKGLVSRRKGPQGKALLFKAVGRPQREHRRIVRDLLQRVFAGDALAVVSSLFETRRPTAEELKQLEELVEQYREGPARTRSKP